MKQFNLLEWLKDKSRKVVTRDGREVRILCIDCGVRESQPILVEITCSRNTKVLEYYNIDGTTQDKNLNLFFADEELVPIQDTKAYQEGVKEGRRLEREDLEELIEDKVAKKFAELLNNLPTQSPLQPNPYPNPFQPTMVLYGCPSTQSDVIYCDTKTQQDNE